MTEKITFKDMQKILMDELRLMHYPIAVKFIFKRRTRPGDHFPGADVCKNCPMIVFRKKK